MTNFKNAIKEIAAAGRMGDDILVHMNRAELGGLASLAPGGKLSINPKTGLPEAFFFLPFLAGLGAAAAPAAAAAIPAAAAGAGALGAGMATGMAAALPAIAAPTAAGLSALPAAAAAAVPAAATTATTAMPLVVGGAAPAAAGVGGLGAAPIASQLATMPGISGLTAGASSAAPSVGGLSSIPGGISAAAPLAPGGSMTAATTIPGAGDLAAGIGPAAAAPGEFAAAAGGPGMTLSSPVSPIATPASTGGSALEAAQAGAYPGEYAAAAGGPGAPSMGGTITPASEIAPVNAATASTSGEGGLSGLLGGMDMNTALMGMAMAGQMMPMGGGGGGDEESDEDAGDEEYEGGDPTFPGDDYNPGTDDEWDYFPNYASGGIVHLEGGGGVGQRLRDKRMEGIMKEQYEGGNPQVKRLIDSGMGKYSDAAWANKPKPSPEAPAPAPVATPYVPPNLQGLESLPAANVPPMQLSGFNGVNNIVPPNAMDLKIPQMKRGGPVGYAAGGVAGMMPGQPMPTDPMQAQGVMAQQGLGSLVPQMQPTPQSPLPKEQIGSKTGDESDKQIISDAVAAIQGQHPEPDKALMEFVQTFGEQALQDLVQRVKGAGPMGDGMSDSVPATIDGSQPAALSQGEFVVPADVVSGLGNGDTKAGSNQLFGMMDRVRTMRGGGPVQPPAINPSMVMPA